MKSWHINCLDYSIMNSNEKFTNTIKEGYLIDMDGTLTTGGKLIPGADEFIDTLQRYGIPYLLLTNNSERTPRDIEAKLAQVNIKVPCTAIYTAAQCTAEFIIRQRPTGSAFVIGEGGLLKALDEIGFTINAVDPDYVIIGEGRTLSFELVEKAMRCLAKGAQLISTNPDTWCPTDQGPRPGAGAVAALLESAVGKKCYHLGKPHPFMMLQARHKLGKRTADTVMVGDTFETDIRGAVEMGFQSYLVLTGSAKREDIHAYPYVPTRILDSVADITQDIHGRLNILPPDSKAA